MSANKRSSSMAKKRINSRLEYLKAVSRLTKNVVLLYGHKSAFKKLIKKCNRLQKRIYWFTHRWWWLSQMMFSKIDLKNKNKKTDLYRVVYTHRGRKVGGGERLNVEAFVTSDKRGGAWVLGGRKHLHDVCFCFVFLFHFRVEKLFALATTPEREREETVSLLLLHHHI